MMLMPARTISVSIARPPDAVYAYASDVRNLPHWAPGFAKAVRRGAQVWEVDTADGSVGFEFVPPNELGVLDHRVLVSAEPAVWNHMRVIGNGDGAEVLFTLFQPTGVADEDFRGDLDLVESDLMTLKRLLEEDQRQGAGSLQP